ncbi:MAG TPA: hypothetical protein VIJ25_01160, partial [Methylococcales bacterium]
STATVAEQAISPAENAALANGPGAETRDAIRAFLDGANNQKTAPTTPNAPTAPGPVIGIFPIPAVNFIYVNGGVGNPDGAVNINNFESFFTAPFGVLAGSNTTVLPGPIIARANSTFSPNLTPADINKLVSVKVKFSNFFVSDNNRQLALRLVIRNVTTGSTQIVSYLPPSAGSSYTFNITRYIKTPGQYAIGFVFRKPGGVTDVTGFGETAVVVTRNN